MIARGKVPKHIAEAIERAWPDGVVEMLDLEGRRLDTDITAYGQ